MSEKGDKAAEDYTGNAARKYVFSEAVQHPTTIFSAAVAILGGIYMGLVSFDETSLAVAAGGAVFSLASWVYHYFVRGEKLAAEYQQHRIKQREKKKKRKVQDIERSFRVARFKTGEEAARELKEAYFRLRDFLKEKYKGNMSSRAERFMLLADDAYEQGVQFLNKAYTLYDALSRMDEAKLKYELKDWIQERDELKENTKIKPELKKMMLETVRDKIRLHRRRLELRETREDSLRQVLAQCEVLEATLDASYLEMVDMMDEDFAVQQKDVASKLERAVNATRKVEDRLRGLGRDDADDDIYLKAAQAEKTME